MRLCYSYMSCCTWINISGIIANIRNQQTSYLYKTGWRPFRYILCFVWCQLVWFTEVFTKKYTSVFWYYPPNCFHRGLPRALSSLSGLKCHSHQQHIRWSHCPWKNRNKVNSKKLLPGNWLHNLWVSLWDKSSLTLMVTENEAKIKFSTNLSQMRGWPEEGIVKLIQPGGH